jgi:hypothetical protein
VSCCTPFAKVYPDQDWVILKLPSLHLHSPFEMVFHHRLWCLE